MGNTSVSHLIYIDDVFIFSKGNQKSLRCIKESLTIFSGFSDLDINI